MSEESIRDIRLQKLARMRELGHDPYAVEKWNVTDSAKNLLDGFQGGREVSFAGRVVSYRLMGKAGFAHISDGDGKIQGYFRKDDLGETGWELYNLLDMGDHVGISGKLFLTKTGEKSIHVESLQPLSKPLHAIPIGKEKDGEVELVSIGSSLKLCLVAEGKAHLYPRLGPTMEWDVAAAHAVVNASGAKMTDIDGNPFKYNKENLLNPFFLVVAPGVPL